MSTPGLLYAASRLNSPSRESSDVFNTWYNDIHVRDVLKTSGINSAARYETAAVPQDSSPWTFLALYPVPDIEFLNTEEFTSIPVTSDVLPGPTHSCMDIAHFDIRRYREVGRREDSDMPAGETYKTREEKGQKLIHSCDVGCVRSNVSSHYCGI